ATHGAEDVTITYLVRDQNTRAGRQVPINLGAPTSVTDDFVIQTVTITNFASARHPDFLATAAAARVSLDDVYQRRLGVSMAVTISRTAMTDDDGSGTTGTVWNNAYKTTLYDQIDTALALLLPLAGGTVSGATTVGALLTLTGGQLKFPATQVPSADANTLDDYEEGTWTPTDGSGASLSLTVSTAQYVKVGQIVNAAADITYPSTANGSQATISGLPFTNQTTNASGAMINYSNYSADFRGLVTSGGTQVLFYKLTGASLLNSDLSTLIVRFTAIYRASA